MGSGSTGDNPLKDKTPPLPAGALTKGYLSKWAFIIIVRALIVAWQYGVFVLFRYASGATTQVLIFVILAIEVKRLARTARTLCEIVLTHLEEAAHSRFIFFCLRANIIVTSTLLLGGAGMVNALLGMELFLASLLNPWSVLLHTAADGSKATDNIFLVLVICVYSVYWGKAAHISLMRSCLLTNVIVTTVLSLGGAATVNALTGMIYLTAFLIPWGVMLCMAAGVLKAPFMAPYIHTANIFLVFVIWVYTGYVKESSTDAFYMGLETVRSYTKGECRRIFLEQGYSFLATSFYESGKYSCRAVQDNMEGSYLMMLSGVGLKIWIINIMAEATAQEKAAMGLVRWGKAARTSFIFFCFLAKLIVFNMLLLANEVVQRYAESDAMQTEVVHRYVEDDVTEEEIEEVFDIDGNGMLVLRVRGGMQINVEKLKGRRYLTADLVRGRTQGDGEEYYMPMLFNFGEGGSRAPVSARVTVSFEYRGGYTMLSTSLRGGSRAPVSARVTV